ncbi:MAG TPA: hypothetical protein PLR83_08895 [Pyrinomonadaceae bacterium]|nr:hypothetical protein [Pyrinomonadaceae bacterium]
MLTTAPPLLVRLGLNESEILIPQSVIRKAVEKGGGAAHNIDPAELAHLPRELNDPAIVFNSASKDAPNALVVMTTLKNRDGLPVVAVVKYDASLNADTVNLIPSVHEKDGNSFFDDWVGKGKARYYNKEKDRGVLELIGLSSPEAEKRILATENIITDKDFVNKEAEGGQPLFAAYTQEARDMKAQAPAIKEALAKAFPGKALRAAIESSEISFDSLYNDKGEIDHERVQNTVSKILEGTSSIARLSGQGEQGRIDGGELLIGSSLIVGAETRTSRESDPQKRRNREEELLEAYAKSQNAWIDDIDAFKRHSRRDR